tara:strand:- start:679 stop:861 length:183 start_codon:yes stop_codon:yes gene_type:complete
MDKSSFSNLAQTNQNYRKILVDSTINIMESNESEYNKQTNSYIPESIIEKSKKSITVNLK